MKKYSVGLAFALALIWVAQSWAQEKAPLRLVQTVSVPGAPRKWDHFGVDLQGNRLFATSEDAPAVEVFDLRTNKLIRTLTDFKEPHNTELTIDADPIVYDPTSKYLYVVNGGREAHTPYCLISVVDTRSGKKLAEMKLDTNRLESMAIEKSGPRLFVNMTGVNSIGVVDREKRAVVQTWPLTAGQENVPMQYDEAMHRLFVVTRKPSKLIVLNTDTGKEVTSLAVADYVDDLAYDGAHHRLYVPAGGGDGAVSVVEQQGANDYRVIATVPTKPGAKTARLVPELNKYYVGVPGKGSVEPQILVFEVTP